MHRSPKDIEIERLNKQFSELSQNPKKSDNPKILTKNHQVMRCELCKEEDRDTVDCHLMQDEHAKEVNYIDQHSQKDP